MTRVLTILALTLLALVAWSRSLFVLDLLSHQSGTWRTVVLVFPGGVSFQRLVQAVPQERAWRWESGRYGHGAHAGGVPWRWLGFYVQATNGELRINLPFWPVVALSSFLALLEWRRRKVLGERGFEVVEPVVITGLVPVEGRR